MPAPEGPDALRITADAHQVGVDLDISDLVGRLEREALRLIDELSRQGLEGEELAEAVSRGLAGLSDSLSKRAARGAISEAFNLGRNLEVQEREEEIQEAVRTEVLDAATCPPCRKLDGRVFEVNTPEYFEFMPPTKCNGRELCRGFYLLRRRAA